LIDWLIDWSQPAGHLAIPCHHHDASNNCKHRFMLYKMHLKLFGMLYLRNTWRIVPSSAVILPKQHFRVALCILLNPIHTRCLWKAITHNQSWVFSLHVLLNKNCSISRPYIPFPSLKNTSQWNGFPEKWHIFNLHPFQRPASWSSSNVSSEGDMIVF
jgi:hypothetical protein